LFNLYKFRYMKWQFCIKDAYWKKPKDDKALKFEKELIEKNSTRNWPLYKIKDDPRKTKIWHFIEKYSIDEFPQFFNLILWNMSLVWPRPHQPREVDKYSLEEKRLLTIKPWITWMAQVNWRDTNDFKKESELDIFYIENWNSLLDLKIILKTFSVIFSRK
jgi:lipopolysaccharide/colanic/teichoic acid biosynthesis glycosyltransferase